MDFGSRRLIKVILGPCVFGFRVFSASDAEFAILRRKISTFFYAEKSTTFKFLLCQLIDFVTKIISCPPKIPPIPLNDSSVLNLYMLDVARLS